jgi:hypothetical protein
MKKWFRLTTLEGRVLAVVLLVLLAVVLTEVSTVRDSATNVCTKCLAHRRTVSRKIMWRVVEDRDEVHPLAGNEGIDCQHQWMFTVGSHWSGLGGGYVADGPSDGPSTPELRKLIEEYEKRTRRDYRDEVQKVLEAARRGTKK